MSTDGRMKGAFLERRLRVAHVHDRLSGRSGADLHLLMLLSEQRLSIDLSLAVGWRDGSVVDPDQTTVGVIKGLGGRDSKSSAAARRLTRWLDAQNPDVVHIHNVMQADVISAVSRLWPAVMTVQDHRTFCPGRGKWTLDEQVCDQPMADSLCRSCFSDRDYGSQMLTRTQERLRALSGLERVIVLSEYMKRELVGVGVDQARIAVIPPSPFGAEPIGAHSAVPAPVDGPFWIAAGRWVRAKGFHMLIEAWSGLEDPLPLVIVGVGPEAEALREQQHAAPFPERLHLIDWVERGVLHAWVARAQALVFSSLWQEPFGLAGLEALALGTPVIAFNGGAVSEWMHERSGWLVPWGEVSELRTALDAARDGAECSQRGEYGMRDVRARFEPVRIAAQVRGQYEALSRVSQA